MVDTWIQWPDNDCRRAHPRGGCSLEPNSFRAIVSPPGHGTRPLPDLNSIWPKPRYYRTFEVRADHCCCCEFRQRVRGFTSLNGHDQPFQLPGGPLLRGRYREDGVFDHLRTGRVRFYGHRSDEAEPIDEYLGAVDSDQANGCLYRSRDVVSVPDERGWHVRLKFEGVIINICTRTVLSKRIHWEVEFDT
jgi:hypothetical protein